MYPFVATANMGMIPNRIPDRSTANDLAELLRRIKRNIFQGGSDRKGLNDSMSVTIRSIFPGIGAKNPVRNATTKRAVRETTYSGIFRSGM